MSLDYPYSKIKENGFVEYFLAYVDEVPGWVDMERLIKDIIEHFQKFFSDYRNIIDLTGTISASYENISQSDLFDKRFIDCILRFPLFYSTNEKCVCIKPKYYTEAFGLNKREVIRLLRTQLDEVVELLRLYLQNYCYEKKKGNLKAKKQILDIHPSYVISFNYTDTYKV